MLKVRTILSGRVAVEVDGAAAPLSRQTQRLVVALAASRGLPVPTDTLVERLWDEPPTRPEPTLRVVVKRAREQLGSDDIIETGPIGRSWAGPSADVDLWTFESRAEQALRPGTADRDGLEEILATWRGEPFGPFGRLPFLLPLSTHLEELHRSLEELWLRCLLDAGTAAQAVLAAEAMVEAEPLRENRWAALMLALYRDGRQTDALRAYQRARHVLLDMAGVAPGRDLEQLERRILDHDDGLLSAPASVGRPTSSERPVLVGRQVELRLLTQGLGSEALCLLGEPGIGKTALLDDAVAVLRQQGRAVIAVAAPRSPARPAMVIAQIIEELAARYGLPDDPVLRAALVTVAPDVVEGSHGATPPVSATLERAELVERIAAHLTQVTSRTATVIAVDDCQWIDRLTSDILRLVRSTGSGGLLLATQPTADAHLDWVVRDGPVRVVELGGLDESAARLLLQQRGLASSVVSRAEELRDRSGGNPLLLGLLGEAASTNDRSRAPSDVEGAVVARLDLLSRRALETLQVASVLGRRFSLSDLVALRPTAPTDLIEAIDARLVGRLPDDDPDLPEAHGFVHGLVAEVVSAQLAGGRRVELCDDIGRMFLDRGRAAIVSAPYLLAAAPLDRARAARAGLRAGDEHRRAFAFDEALKLYEAGLDALQAVDPSISTHLPLRAELLIRSGSMLRLLGERSAADRLLEGIDAARTAGLPELFAQGDQELCGHGSTTTAGRTDPVGVALLDEALAMPISERTAAQLCGAAATLLTLSAKAERGRELFLRASRTARQLGDADLEAEVLMNIHLGLSDPDDLALRLEATERLEQLAGDRVERRWETAFLQFGHALVLADRPALDRAMEAVRLLTPSVDGRSRAFGLGLCETAHAHATGDRERARSALDQVLSVGMASFDPSWAVAVYSSILLSLCIDDGTLGTLAGPLDAMISDMPEVTAWRCAAALVAVEAGDHRRASEELRWGLRDDLAHLTRDQTWMPALVCMARAAVGLGDEDAAKVIYPHLLPHRGRMTWAGTCTYGPVDLILGLLQRAIGNQPLAAGHFTEGNVLATRLGCLQYVA